MDIFAAKNMAILYMAQYNLIEQGWSFSMDMAKRRFGVCKHRSKRISLSVSLTRLNSVDDVKDTILHEIAHALVGPKIGHGPEWKAMCLRVGAKPERCYDESVNTTPPKYTATCICGEVYERLKRPTQGRRYSCKCQEKKFPKVYLIWKLNLVSK